MSKTSYRVKNWKQYNKSLIKRGNITIWFCEEALESWYCGKSSDGRGRPLKYSNSCIELALTIRTLFKLPLRATQGFIEGMVTLLDLDLDVPNYTRLSRRAKGLKVKTPKKRGKNLDLVIDSTGLKIYGEGEWKMRTHGKQGRRTWRKYHVAVDPDTMMVVSHELTTTKSTDDHTTEELLKDLKKAGDVYADGAYGFKRSMDAIAKVNGCPYIPVRTGTCRVTKNPSPGESLRNELIEEIKEYGGKVTWKKDSPYHKRSLVETHMYRLKTICGDKLKSRNFENQKTEADIMTLILNKMTLLGMPKSVRI